MSRRRGARAVLATGVLAGVATALVFPASYPEQVALASDRYHAAALAALHGGALYDGAAPFLYPPPVVAAFYPHAVLGGPTLAYALQTALNLAGLAALAALSVRVTERAGAPLDRLDRALVAGVFLASPLSVVNLVNGQVNPLLALALCAGAVLLERDRGRASGVAFGLAALVKLFPALVGAWLLRRRAWTAIAAATATGLGLLLAGLAAFGPGPYETYVSRVLTGELAVASFPGGPDHRSPYVTVRRQLSLVAPGLSGAALLAASLAVFSPVVAAANRVVDTVRQRLVALQATLLATLAAFPLESFYLLLALFPLVPLLYLLEDGTPRRLFLAGGLLVLVPVTYADVLLLTGMLPGGAAAAVEGLARVAFTVALPPTVGVWLVLAGCVLHQHLAADDAAHPGGRMV